MLSYQHEQEDQQSHGADNNWTAKKTRFQFIGFYYHVPYEESARSISRPFTRTFSSVQTILQNIMEAIRRSFYHHLQETKMF